MNNFVHAIPTKLYFGKGQIENLPAILGAYGKNVLMVYGGGSIKKNGLYDKIMALLADFNVYECAGVEPNPRLNTVVRGAEICRANNVDVIVAVGGGSTSDCSKAISSYVNFEGTKEDFWEKIKTRSLKVEKKLPLVDVLTLAATGSEFDGGGVITNSDTNEKMGSGFCYPVASICDPEYTFSVSKYQTASGSADIMSHIFEGYFNSVYDADLSDGIATTVLKSVIKNLPIALAEPDNYSARGNLMMCASIACSGVPEYGKAFTGWPCHGMEHELSAYYDIAHGMGLAVLTPRWMRFILNKDKVTALPRFVKFAKEVWGFDGEDEEALAYKAIEALEEFFKKAGVPANLTEMKIDESKLEIMADHCAGAGQFAKAFVPLTKEDVVAIYKASL